MSHPPSSVGNMQQTDSDLGFHGPASDRHRVAGQPSEGPSTAPSTATATPRFDVDAAGESDPGSQVVAGATTDLPLGALEVLAGDPAALDATGLGVFLGAVRAVRSWVDAREAAALRAAARCDAAREAGATDTAGWLARHTGVGRREALARERTAAELEDVPEVSAALAEGRLTHGHARVLAQFAAPPDVDLSVEDGVDFPDPVRDAARRVAAAVRAQPDELIAAAESLSIDAFRRFMRRWADLAAGDDGAGRDIAQRRRRRVTVFETDDGMRGVRGLLPADRFAFFENELRRLAEARWRADHPDAEGVPAKALTCPQRNADALVDMARRSRELGDNNGEPLGSHIDVMVLIDQETLTAGLHDDGRCELDDTMPVSPVAARRLLCDADIVGAVGESTAFRGADAPGRAAGNGVLPSIGERRSWKLDLGYTRRAADPKIRRALIARDRTCTAPGCDRPHWMCEIHHVVPWSEGGRTDLDNLTLLCSRHHHLHHANESSRTNRTRAPNSPNAPPDRPPPAEVGAATTSSRQREPSRSHGSSPPACRPTVGVSKRR